MNVSALTTYSARGSSRETSLWLPLLALLGGGGAIATVFYVRNREKIAELVSTASIALPAGTPSVNEVTLKTTGYWPYAAKTELEKKMEGGTQAAAIWRGVKAIDPNTGKRPVIYTLEQHLAGKAPYCTISGDPSIWPFGQRISIDAWPGAIFRYTDTGGNFTDSLKGAERVVRVIGQEPTDIAVDSKNTKIPSIVKARVISGDSFVPGHIATASIGRPTVAGDITDAYTAEDADALARALASIAVCDEECARAVAWVCRNRAAALGQSVADMLAPGGVYGPADTERFASTRRPATPDMRAVADEVLGASPDVDVTGGAVDFWVPDHQASHKAMGDLYRVALERGDEQLAAEYAGYQHYTQSDDAVRAWQAKNGLVPAGRVGPIEILRYQRGA